MCEICFKLTIKTTVIDIFWCFYRQLNTYFTPFSSVSSVDFEQVNSSWMLISKPETEWLEQQINYWCLDSCWEILVCIATDVDDKRFGVSGNPSSPHNSCSSLSFPNVSNQTSSYTLTATTTQCSHYLTITASRHILFDQTPPLTVFLEGELVK